MPNAPTHDRAALITAATVGTVAQLSGVLPTTDSIILAASIIINNYYLSPDLDIVSASYYRWGFLKAFWLPYQKVIHHRSWLSHSSFISYTIRLMYMLVFLLPIIAILFNAGFTLPEQWIYYFALFYVGGCISDTLHMILDGVF